MAFVFPRTCAASAVAAIAADAADGSRSTASAIAAEDYAVKGDVEITYKNFGSETMLRGLYNRGLTGDVTLTFENCDLSQGNYSSDNTVANMASSAARACGLSIPEDIVITGLNGIKGVRAGIPDLTGCNRNLTLMADKCVELIEKALREEKIEDVVLPTDILYSESCGCKRPEEDPNVGVLIRHLTLQREMAATQQRRQIGMVAKLIRTTDKAVMFDIFRDILPADSYLCLRGNFLDDLSGQSALKELSATEKFIVVSARNRSWEGRYFDHDFLR